MAGKSGLILMADQIMAGLAGFYLLRNIIDHKDNEMMRPYKGYQELNL